MKYYTKLNQVGKIVLKNLIINILGEPNIIRDNDKYEVTVGNEVSKAQDTEYVIHG